EPATRIARLKTVRRMLPDFYIGAHAAFAGFRLSDSRCAAVAHLLPDTGDSGARVVSTELLHHSSVVRLRVANPEHRRPVGAAVWQLPTGESLHELIVAVDARNVENDRPGFEELGMAGAHVAHRLRR